MNTQQVIANNEARSLELAEAIGRRLKGGEVIELISDLGGGKTTFVRGLAQGAGAKAEDVKSPSFTIEHEYRANDLLLRHYDFYRLNEPGTMKDQLAEVLQDKTSVVAIEWADTVKDILPDNRLQINIRATGEKSREYTINYPSELSYLVLKD